MKVVCFEAKTRMDTTMAVLRKMFSIMMTSNGQTSTDHDYNDNSYQMEKTVLRVLPQHQDRRYSLIISGYKNLQNYCTYIVISLLK